MSDETIEVAVPVDLEKLPKYIAEAMLLLGKGEYDPLGPSLRERCFVMADASIFGCLIEETFDSFLVALPTVITIDDKGESSGKLTPHARVVRILKTGVHSMIIPNDQQQYFYHKHLVTLYDWMPDFFSEAKKEYIQFRMKKFEEESPGKKRFLLTDDLDVVDSLPLVTWEMPDGVSDKAFQYLYIETTKQ